MVTKILAQEAALPEISLDAVDIVTLNPFGEVLHLACDWHPTKY
jgi:hypothetical protein